MRDRFQGCVVRAAKLLLCISLCLLPSVLFAQKNSIPSQPKLSVSSAVHNFGAVAQGTLVEHAFELKNAGEGELVLQRIVPACGCTATSSSADVIAPGQSATLNVTFDTTGFAGEKVKIVRVYTNDPDKLSTVLTLKGRVEPDVVVNPVRVSFGKVVTGEEGKLPPREVIVRTRGESDVKLGAVSSRSKYLKLTEMKSTSSEKRFSLTLLEDVPLGQLRDRVVVSVRGSSQRSVQIPVFANIQTPMEISPGSVSFGVLDGETQITRSVRLENKGEAPIQIRSVKSRHPAIGVETTTITPGKIYVVKVSVDPKKVAKDLRSSFEITTDEKDQEPLLVSVYGILPPSSS